jgi:hypothetical protein
VEYVRTSQFGMLGIIDDFEVVEELERANSLGRIPNSHRTTLNPRLFRRSVLLFLASAYFVFLNRYFAGHLGTINRSTLNR